jgi:hypothetical protein
VAATAYQNIDIFLSGILLTKRKRQSREIFVVKKSIKADKVHRTGILKFGFIGLLDMPQ